MYRRFSGAAALAFAAVLSFGPTAFADSNSGTSGDYLFTDDASHVGAVCKYKQDSNDPNTNWISKITASAPSLWWPDQNSSTNTEHGKVGWRFLVQYSTTGGWTRAAQSPIQKATAYEDSQHPYAASTKAHLTNQTVSFNGKASGDFGMWRVVVNTFWYATDGHVMGNVNHVVQYYNVKYSFGSGPVVVPSGNPDCNAEIKRL